MVIVVTRTARENNPQPVAYLCELVVRQLEVNENLVEASHLASGGLVETQGEAVTPKRCVSDAAMNNVALNRNLDVNSANPWSVILCAAASLHQQAVKRRLVGWVTREPNRECELALINGGVIGNELMLRSFGVRLWHKRKAANRAGAGG